jgi:hypothetical protein
MHVPEGLLLQNIDRPKRPKGADGAHLCIYGEKLSRVCAQHRCLAYMGWSPGGQTKKTVTLRGHRVHRKTQCVFVQNVCESVDALHPLLRASVVPCAGLVWRSLPLQHGQHVSRETRHSKIISI